MMRLHRFILLGLAAILIGATAFIFWPANGAVPDEGNGAFLDSHDRSGKPSTAATEGGGIATPGIQNGGSFERRELTTVDAGTVVVSVFDRSLAPQGGAEVFAFSAGGRRGRHAYARLAHDAAAPGTRFLGITGSEGELAVPLSGLPESGAIRAVTRGGAIGQAMWSIPADLEAVVRVNVFVEQGHQILIRAREEGTGAAISDAPLVARWRRPTGVEVLQVLRTDAAGECVISMAPGATRVQTILEASQFQQCHAGPFDPPLPTTVELTAARGAGVRGRVFAASGEPASGIEVIGWNVPARVRASDVLVDLSEQRWSKRARTDYDGQFLVTGLQVGMTAVLAARASGGAVLVVVPPDSEDVRIDLPGTGVLRGRVDVSHPGGQIAVVSARAPAWPPVAILDVDAEGEFGCEVLEGRYGLLFFGGGRFGTAGPIDISAGASSEVITVSTEPSWSLGVRLYAPDGREVPDGWVRVRGPALGAFSPQELGPSTWKSLLVSMVEPWEEPIDGTDAPEFFNLPPGTLEFRVGAPGMTTRTLEITGAPGEAVVRRIQVAGAIRGSLRFTLFGEPVGGHRVSMRPIDLGQGEPVVECIPDRNGIALVQSLRPGTWEVSIHVATGPVVLGQFRILEDGEVTEIALDGAFPSRLEIAYEDPGRRAPHLTPNSTESYLERSWTRSESQTGVTYTRIGLVPGRYLLWSQSPSDGQLVDVSIGLTSVAPAD